MSRRNYYTGKYKLSKEEFLSAKYYALRYNSWLSAYNALKDSVGAIVYDGMPHGSGTGNPTESLAIKRDKLRKKMALIEDTAREADPELASYIMKAVTNEDVTFHHLKTLMDMPCGQKTYYDRRRRFYWLLAKKI